MDEQYEFNWSSTKPHRQIEHGTLELFFRLLKHTSPDNTVKSSEITDATGLPGPIIRSLVSACRRVGVPISSSSKGYFVQTDPDKYMQEAEHMRSRAKKMLKTYHLMEKYAGQVNRLELWPTPFILDRLTAEGFVLRMEAKEVSDG